MSPMVARIAETIDPGAFVSRRGPIGERQLRALRKARLVLERMMDAPKDALVAGSLWSEEEKDLNIWNEMILEMLRN